MWLQQPKLLCAHRLLSKLRSLRTFYPLRWPAKRILVWICKIERDWRDGGAWGWSGCLGCLPGCWTDTCGSPASLSWGGGRHRQPWIMEEKKEKVPEVYDLIQTIWDPEKPNTLEEGGTGRWSGVEVEEINEDYLVTIRFTPTVPHCSLASLIWLCR